MKNLTDLVNKTYAARGTFTEIRMDQKIEKGYLAFEAVNNRMQSNVEGIIFNFNKDNEDLEQDYRVQLTKIHSKDHIIDLSRARNALKKLIDPTQNQYNIAIENKGVIETYSGTIVSKIPIIKEVSIFQKHNDKKDCETEVDVHALKDSLQIGFRNVIYERHKDKISIIRTNVDIYQQMHARKSVIIGVLDGEFITEDLQEDSDESLIKRTYTPIGYNSQIAHVRAGHIRHYQQENGSVILVAVAPYVVKPQDLATDQKEKYYLGPRGEITQETLLLTDKKGSLEDAHVMRLIKEFGIDKLSEL